jgi:hypothetical protein
VLDEVRFRLDDPWPNLSRGTDGLQTRRWRESDSNCRSPVTMNSAGRLAARGAEGGSARFLLLGEPFHGTLRIYGFGGLRCCGGVTSGF